MSEEDEEVLDLFDGMHGGTEAMTDEGELIIGLLPAC